MWSILGVSIVIWIIGLYRLVVLQTYESSYRRFKGGVTKKVDGSTGIEAFDRLDKRLDEEKIAAEYAYRSFLLEVVPRLQSGLGAMKTWIAAAPLLGLLGTVTGMVQTFRVIMHYGIGNPHMMAEGISVALLTTQAGLMVAFPGMLLHNVVLSRKNAFVNKLLRDGEELGRLQAGCRDV
ncbi:MAG: MotA/TolQ/ExbB proton channel family protein [Fibrobacterota bacterium]